MKINVPRNMNASTYFLDDNLEAGRADKTAIYTLEEEVSYKEIFSRVNAVGRALLEFGVGIGDRVLMIMSDSPHFVSAYFGAIRIGAVPVPVNTFFLQKDYMFILNDSRAKVLVADPLLIDFVEPNRSQLPYLQTVILTEKHEQVKGDAVLSDIYRELSGELAPVILTSDDMAYWLYSSGTTGFPKGVVHLQHDLLYCDLYGKGILGFTEEDRSFSTSKLFFAYALGNSIHIPFKNGGSCVLLAERPSLDNVSLCLKKFRPTLFFSVPTFYSLLLRQLVDPSCFHSVRSCVSAGESLPDNMFWKWKEQIGVTILEGLGSTEFTYMVLSNVIGGEKPGSPGKIIPGNEAKLLNEKGDICQPGEVGRLMVKSEHTGAFYWNQHQKSKEAFIGEWMNTGDCFYQDDEGYFYYVGRGDDLIKSSGIWVYPLEVESVINEHDDIVEAVVVGEPDDEGLVKIVSYVKLADHVERNEASRSKIMEYLRQKLPGFKCPKIIHFVDEIPKTATGKIMRYKLKETKGISNAPK